MTSRDAYPAPLTAPALPLSLRLTTERLVLRAPKTSDVGALRHAARRNAEHLRPWNPRPPPGEDPTSITQVSNGILRERKAWRKGEGYAFWMFDPKDDERVLGRVHLSNVRRGAFQNTYLGYWCDVDSQTRGLMTEAVRTVVGFAFEVARLHRVQAAVMPRNVASLRVLEKLKFRNEGFAARYLQIAGTWEDHVILAVTREEWHGVVPLPQ